MHRELPSGKRLSPNSVGETMHPVLADIIDRFRAAQDRGVAVVAEVLGGTLGVCLPTSNREWVAICADCGLHTIRSINGIGVYVHGYGIELVLDDVMIDFDWGELGEPDGFDAWRLWRFVSVNRIDVPCESMAQVRGWLEEAHQCGELKQDQLYGLYYSPAHRVRGCSVPQRTRPQGG
jgi:Domain of unknown function (DUF6896)